MSYKFKGEVVLGNCCNRCNKEVEWFWIPDSLASACKECGFVRIDCVRMKNEDGIKIYEAGPTVQEWLDNVYGSKKVEEK